MCDSLLKNNFNITLIGRLLDDSRPIDRAYKTKRFNLIFNKGILFYTEYNIRLFLFLLFTKKDMLFSNDLDTLLPNYIISVFQRKKLIFDSHELFSEIPELVNKQQVKKVWLFLEKTIIPKLQNVITVSNSIKNHYHHLYGISAIVIRNIPKTEHVNQKKTKISNEGKKVILYQGSVNIGRGIELMIDTMPLLNEYLFVVIGDGDILQQLREKVTNLSLHNKVKFLGKKTPEELKELTPNATIGISLEEDLGLNYRYALPNKIFDYLHANVPVIVANLPEMRGLIKKHPIGEILSERTPKTLAKTIINMTNNSYEKDLKTAKKELNWSTEEEKLISIFSKLDK